MKIISQAATRLDTASMTQYQIIERVGRTCYKSEDKITDDSAKNFVASLVKSGHHAMIEFGYVYMRITDPIMSHFFNLCKPHFIHKSDDRPVFTRSYSVGNLRAYYDWFESWFKIRIYDDHYHMPYYHWFIRTFAQKWPEIYEDLYKRFMDTYKRYAGQDNDKIFEFPPFEFLTRDKFIEEIKENGLSPREISFLIPHIVMFTTNRGVSHELCRHRDCVSFAMESTRYCNYSKGKFGSEITVIEPMFEPGSDKYQIWYDGCLRDEEDYFKLLNLGATPQEARGKLPNDLKADLWMGAFEDEWQHIINLRYHGTTGAPHPQCKELIGLVHDQLVKASEGRLK